MKVKINGLSQLRYKINVLSNSIRKPTFLLKNVGKYLVDDTYKNMSEGKDYNRRKLPPLAPFIRKLQNSKTNIPLFNKKRLANSLSYKISNNFVVVFFKGKYNKIAENMINGKKGRMYVYKSNVRTSKKGNQYTRVETKNGKYRTLQVKSGYIKIKPKSRKFFGLSKKQEKNIITLINSYITKITRRF